MAATGHSAAFRGVFLGGRPTPRAANAGMGSSIDIDIFEEVRRAPKATLSGVASQYLFMPAITFGLCIAFDLGNTEALALQLCGMCPGGVTSTFFTYVCRANVSLSLILTTCSNFLAIGMMPFLVWVYVRPPLVSRNEDTKVNYLSIVGRRAD